MIVSDPEPTLVPGVRLDGPTDPTGAGDSATASAVLALAAGAELPEAALLGNLVASITVEQLATTGTARCEELPDRLALWREQQCRVLMDIVDGSTLLQFTQIIGEKVLELTS